MYTFNIITYTLIHIDMPTHIPIHTFTYPSLPPSPHSQTHRNEKEAAIVLLEAGADPNLQTETGLSPIATAIHKDSADVVELLANHPKIDLCLPVCSSVKEDEIHRPSFVVRNMLHVYYVLVCQAFSIECRDGKDSTVIVLEDSTFVPSLHFT